MVLALTLAAAPAQAQLRGIAKKVLPGGTTAPAAPAQSVSTPAGGDLDLTFTDDVLDRLLIGMGAEAAVLDSATRAAQGRKDSVDAVRQQGAMAVVNRRMQYEQCLSDQDGQDPRAAQRDQLYQAATAAEDRGDSKQAKSLNAQADSISAAMRKTAEAACRSFYVSDDDMAKAYQALPADVDVRQAVRGISPAAQDRGAAAGQFTPLLYAQLKERVEGILRAPTRHPMTDAERAAFDARRAQLQQALRGLQG